MCLKKVLEKMFSIDGHDGNYKVFEVYPVNNQVEIDSNRVALSYKFKEGLIDYEYYLYETGFLKKEGKIYLYSLKNLPNKNNLSFDSEINLKREENICIEGMDIFMKKIKNKWNIIKLKNKNEMYLEREVDKIEYFYSDIDLKGDREIMEFIYPNIELKKGWRTLEYIVTYNEEERKLYKVEKRELKEINLEKIGRGKIIFISKDTDTIILENDNEVSLWNKGEKNLEADKFIMKSNNLYLFEKNKKIKLFDKEGKKIKKGSKVINKSKNVVVIKNTNNHKKEILYFDEESNSYIFSEIKYSLNDKVYIIEIEEKDQTVFINIYGKKIVIEGNLGKSPKYILKESVSKKSQSLGVIEYFRTIKRKSLYYFGDAKGANIILENSREYILDLEELGFVKLPLPFDKDNRMFENNKEYKKVSLEKIYLEAKDEVNCGQINKFYIVYRIEEKERIVNEASELKKNLLKIVKKIIFIGSEFFDDILKSFKEEDVYKYELNLELLENSFINAKKEFIKEINFIKENSEEITKEMQKIIKTIVKNLKINLTSSYEENKEDIELLNQIVEDVNKKIKDADEMFNLYNKLYRNFETGLYNEIKDIIESPKYKTKIFYKTYMIQFLNEDLVASFEDSQNSRYNLIKNREDLNEIKKISLQYIENNKIKNLKNSKPLKTDKDISILPIEIIKYLEGVIKK